MKEEEKFFEWTFFVALLVAIIIFSIFSFTGCKSKFQPSGGSYKCKKYCEDTYDGKYDNGAWDLWIHSYKCKNTTLFEDFVGVCSDEDGFYQDCVKYTCIQRS